MLVNRFYGNIRSKSRDEKKKKTIYDITHTHIYLFCFSFILKRMPPASAIQMMKHIANAYPAAMTTVVVAALKSRTRAVKKQFN